jgi:protein tyrosine phosphatase (PTP) superfamily phosphohydrolase (DUF442 family)
MKTQRITDISGLNFLWQVDNLYCAGQPGEESFAEIKSLGVTTVFNLRDVSEMDFSFEEKACAELGMEYIQFPLMVNGQLSTEACHRLSESIDDNEKWFIHCGSANRIGGWLITYLVKYRNMDFEEAVEIASNNGLTNPGFIEQAQSVLGS